MVNMHVEISDDISFSWDLRFASLHLTYATPHIFKNLENEVIVLDSSFWNFEGFHYYVNEKY